VTGKARSDYYFLLGLSRDARLSDIKRAYRQLARKYHPDTGEASGQDQELFKEITEAYNVLSDPAQRKAYDSTYKPAPGTAVTTPGESPAASRLLAVLEDTWTAIRRHHGQVPSVVIIIASGTDSRQPKWGHYASGRWYASNVEHAEVMISGEGLARTPREVLGTLLHEAAHALAAARGITGTSRQGRYHNKRYAILAAELGLDVAETPGFGWTITTVPDTTAARYASQLAALNAAMTLWRNSEHDGSTTTTRRNTNLIAAQCSCGRKIRIAASTLDEAPIICQACGGSFEPAS
jgi:DnaJ domain